MHRLPVRPQAKEPRKRRARIPSCAVANSGGGAPYGVFFLAIRGGESGGEVLDKSQGLKHRVLVAPRRAIVETIGAPVAVDVGHHLCLAPRPTVADRGAGGVPEGRENTAPSGNVVEFQQPVEMVIVAHDWVDGWVEVIPSDGRGNRFVDGEQSYWMRMDGCWLEG